MVLSVHNGLRVQSAGDMPVQLAVSLRIWRAAADVSVDPYFWCLYVSDTQHDVSCVQFGVPLHLFGPASGNSRADTADAAGAMRCLCPGKEHLSAKALFESSFGLHGCVLEPEKLRPSHQLSAVVTKV